jgi:uncharacterized protein (TIGR00645 family)
MRDHPDQPEWLSHVNANVLKVKLAMAIVGISSIHLLKTFIEAGKVDSETLLWQTIIHLAFVASAIALAVIDRFLSPKSTVEHILEANGDKGPPAPAPAQAS